MSSYARSVDTDFRPEFAGRPCVIATQVTARRAAKPACTVQGRGDSVMKRWCTIMVQRTTTSAVEDAQLGLGGDEMRTVMLTLRPCGAQATWVELPVKQKIAQWRGISIPRWSCCATHVPEVQQCTLTGRRDGHTLRTKDGAEGACPDTHRAAGKIFCEPSTYGCFTVDALLAGRPGSCASRPRCIAVYRARASHVYATTDVTNHCYRRDEPLLRARSRTHTPRASADQSALRRRSICLNAEAAVACEC